MSTGPAPGYHTSEDEQTPPQAGLRAGALPRDGRVPQLRHQLHDHLDPRGVPDLVHDRIRARRPRRGDLGLAPRRAHVTIIALGDGRDRLGVPHGGRPLLLGVEAREPGLGLGHGLVQPDRPDRRDGGDRLRPRDLRDRCSSTTGSTTRTHMDDWFGVSFNASTYIVYARLHARGDRHQHVQHPDHVGAEHDLGVVAHGRRRPDRRHPDRRPRPPPVRLATSSPRR